MCSVSYVSWVERVEQCLEELGWSGREFCRRAGVGTPVQWSITSTRVKKLGDRAQPTATTVEAFNRALEEAGYSGEWIRTGEGEPRTTEERPAERVVEYEGRYAASIEAALALVADGFDQREVSSVLSRLALKEGDSAPTALDIYRLARLALGKVKGARP